LIIALYNTVSFEDFGIAIVMVTVILKTILIPVSKKQIESQKKMQEIQPKLKAIQEKHKNDKEKQTKEIMKFYKKNNVNPFSGCLPLIVQLIFLIAFYRIIINISEAGLSVNNGELYSFVNDPEKINHMFIGIVDLTKPSIVLALLAAAAQYWQTKMMMDTKDKEDAEKKDKKEEKKEKKTEDSMQDFAQIMSKQMMYLGPLLTFFIGIKFAAGLAVYWLVQALFSVFQQLYIFKKK
jgi:YidC/Oxa1 family membrane protein insertase